MDALPYHDREMTVLQREQRMAWLDTPYPERELLRPFNVSRLDEKPAQAAFAF